MADIDSFHSDQDNGEIDFHDSKTISDIDDSNEQLKDSFLENRNFSFENENTLTYDPFFIDDQGNNDQEWHLLNNIFFKNMTNYFCMQLKNLHNVWIKMGLTDKCYHKKIKGLTEEITRTLDIFIEKEQALYQSYVEEIDSLKKKIEILLEEMIIYISDDQLRKYLRTSGESTNICEERLNKNQQNQMNQLKEMFQTLTDFRNKYIIDVAYLQNELKTLMQILEINPKTHHQYDHLLSTHLLDSNKLDELRNAISGLSSLLYERELYCDHRAKMICFMAKIIPLQLNDETFLVDNLNHKNYQEEKYLNNSFVYSESNIENLEKSFETIKEEFKDLWGLIKLKFQQLEKIYVLFDLDNSCIESFYLIQFILTQHAEETEESLLDFLYANWQSQLPKDFNLKQIYQEFSAEYRYYEKLKSERIEEIIKNIRNKYMDLLAKCLVDTRSLIGSDLKYNFLFNGSFDSALLELHERELTKLEQYYKKYEGFFELVSEFRKLEEEIAEYEQQSQHVYKLKNRGGIMLKISNKLRSNKKKLVRIKKQIKHWYMEKDLLLDDNNGLPFDLYGIKIKDTLPPQLILGDPRDKVSNQQRKNSCR